MCLGVAGATMMPASRLASHSEPVSSARSKPAAFVPDRLATPGMCKDSGDALLETVVLYLMCSSQLVIR